MKGSLAAAVLLLAGTGCGVAAGGGAEAGAALPAELGAEEVPLLDFLIKSAKGSAVTAGAGAPGGWLLAAAPSAGVSAVAGLLCKAPLGFQSLFFCVSTASCSAERDWFLLLKGMGTLVTYIATPRATVRPMTRPRMKPSKVLPRWL